MKIVFYSRDFSILPPSPLLDSVSVDRYSWDVIGGPETLTASAPVTVDKWGAFNYLRAPIEVYDEDSRMVWWGYVSKITVPEGAVKFTMGIDDVYNTVATSYTTVATTDTPSVQAGTAWATDALSINDFGAKEKIITGNDATATTAAALRDNFLARYRYPIQNVEFGSSNKIQFECSGWWNTLNWTYYTSTDTSSIDTMTQVSNMITAEGQFMAGITIDGATSGLTSPAYRDPFDKQKTVMLDVQSLLQVGNSSGKRYMAKVTHARYVFIEPEPSEDVQYLMTNSGTIETLNGMEISPARCLVGAWVAIKGAQSVQFGTSSARPVFIESAEYSAAQNKMTPKFAGARDPLSITEIE